MARRSQQWPLSEPLRTSSKQLLGPRSTPSFFSGAVCHNNNLYSTTPTGPDWPAWWPVSRWGGTGPQIITLRSPLQLFERFCVCCAVRLVQSAGVLLREGSHVLGNPGHVEGEVVKFVRLDSPPSSELKRPFSREAKHLEDHSN